MGICSSCRHWDKDGVRTWQNGVVRPANLGGYGQCICETIQTEFTLLSSKELSELPPNGAVVEFNEEWGILTGPEFGCVLWEEKGDKK